MLKRIAVKDMTLGMFICEFCGSWMENPLLKTRFLLTDDNDLFAIRDSGIKELWIDTDLGTDTDLAIDTDSKADLETAENRLTQLKKLAEDEAEYLLNVASNAKKTEKSPLHAEIKLAAKLCSKSKTAVISMFNDVRLGKVIEVGAAQELVEEISNSVMRNAHALISLARLKNADEYTYMHSVAVCALMIALARQLNLPETTIREAGLAGLLHDIGKIGIPDKILNKPGKLTDAEFTTVKSHPEIGAQILLEGNQVSAMVMDVVLHHHEKVDGTGYPHRLTGEHISLYAKMGAVCDVYDAITSNRPYKKGWSPAESIRKMAEWSKGHFDESVFQAFVKTVGIYPTGSLVRLESGRLGIVIEQHKTALLTPTVKVFYSTKTKSAIIQETIDLSLQVTKDKIVGRESPDDWGFKNLDLLWSSG